MANETDRGEAAAESTPDKPAPAFGMPDRQEQPRYTKLDRSPESAHMLVVDAIPEGARVLDVGCATGYLAEEIADRRSGKVTGIEISPTAANEARHHCERVIVGDIETLDLDEALGEDSYDIVLFADVLEHLSDPEAVLRKVRPFVAPGGRVVASIPNVAHISVRLALLAGEFRYREAGLLDRTHLRFFTQETVEDLFEASGYVIDVWRRRRLNLQDAEVQVAAASRDAEAELASDADATTYQFILSAYPSDAASRIHALRTALREARTGLRDAQSELEQLQPLRDLSHAIGRATDVRAYGEAVGELDRLRAAHEALEQRLVTERAAFADHMKEFREAYRNELGDLRARVAELSAEIAWRKGVEEERQTQVDALLQRRALRYANAVGRLFRRQP
jgi:2-polyprenyl-3-methyl-5-hydroxy-6-metoxy-1,4-benzoquinol methylase